MGGMNDRIDELKALGFGDPQIDPMEAPDLGPLALGITPFQVYFPATEPEMIVRCGGGKGVAACLMVPDEELNADGTLSDSAREFVLEAGTEACFDYLAD